MVGLRSIRPKLALASRSEDPALGALQAMSSAWMARNVNGPASSTTHHLAGYADTSGALLEDPNVAVSTDTALSNSDASCRPKGG